MALAPGHRLGPYQIVAPIGAGGMGEVYRATDTRLDRTVAVKVLPAHLAQNTEFRQRFEREARIVSNLNHPHICALHDIGQQDGVDFLVMEFLEGETLSARLAHGALALEQALPIAIQIAAALAEAHRHGVSHRDLKPGNVMLTRTGSKLLDFGLAKFTPAGTPAGSTIGASPTEGFTSAGAILGTFQYMSPEQLQGKDADPRSDIFAFGAVLFEMLTGRKAFEGTTPAALAGAILHTEPPSVATPSLDRLIKRCLAKDPEARWQSARDLGAELEWIAESSAPKAVPLPAVAAPAPSRPRLPWVLVAVATAAALVLAAVLFLKPPPEQRLLKLSVVPPEKASFGPNLVLSPDGRRLAFVATGADGRSTVWVRPLDSLVAHPLSGTDGALKPFWSPDSQSLGFFAQGKLKRIDVAGGPAQTLADATAGRGGAWSRDGIIIFAPSAGGPLMQAPATGGESKPLTALDSSRQETLHRWPHFLPDGRRFLFTARSNTRENSGIFAGSLDSKTVKRIVSGESTVTYAPGRDPARGHILFIRENSLMAQPFDAGRLETTGPAVPSAEQVSYSAAAGAMFSASANGILAYRTGAGANSMLAWFDRTGKQVGQAASQAIYISLDLSPDERRVVATLGDAQGAQPDLWLFELARGVSTRFTFDAATDWSPVWSRDGSRIAFASMRNGGSDLYAKVSSGAGTDELLLKSPELKLASDWSPDGRRLLYSTVSAKTGSDLWTLPLEGDRAQRAPPAPYLQTQFNERQGQFSPDGRWVAYVSDEGGASQVYVQPFPPSGAKWQLSTGGGADPRWRQDGKEIFYLAPDRRLMAVEVKTGANLEAGVAKPLFDSRFPGTPEFGRNYGVASNGQRFLLRVPAEESAPAPITVVVNWAGKN